MKTWFGLLLGAALATRGAEVPANSDFNYDPPRPGSYALPVIGAATDGEVLDSRGEPRRLRDLTQGRVTVLSFIYTRCAAKKACPYATGVLRELHEQSQNSSRLKKELRLVSMSFDPLMDTPERMAAYAASAQGRTRAAEWHFVTTRSSKELAPILAGYGQAVDKKVDPGDPTGPLNHTLRVYLIDRRGQIRNIYSSGTLDERLILADIETLLLEERR